MLLEQIETQLLTARKNNDQTTKDTLTLLKASIQNQKIAKQHDLSDDEITSVIKSNVKQLNQTLESAKKSQRQELIDKTLSQLDLLNAYLPQTMSEEDIITYLESNDNFSVDMPFGQAMGLIMKSLDQQVDGQTAKSALKTYLN